MASDDLANREWEMVSPPSETFPEGRAFRFEISKELGAIIFVRNDKADLLYCSMMLAAGKPGTVAERGDVNASCRSLLMEIVKRLQGVTDALDIVYDKRME